MLPRLKTIKTLGTENGMYRAKRDTISRAPQGGKEREREKERKERKEGRKEGRGI